MTDSETTYADIYAALGAAETAGLPVPSVDITWHSASDELAASVIRAFPDLTWMAKESGHQWIAAQFGAIDITAFLDAPAVQSFAARANAAIEAAREPASS